jgi:heme exporter protein C
MLQRIFPVALILALAGFVVAPFMIAAAPYESTMGLVQKIFYYHAPSGMMMFLGSFVSGIASAIYLMKGRPGSDRLAAAAAELTVVFGLIVLVTGPLWARKAWGVWWQWDARLTSSLLVWLMFTSYLLVRKYGGPGSDKLSAAVAIFGMANVPFVYISVNVWRTLHPKTTVIPSLVPGMRGPFWFSTATFLCLFLALLAVRVRLGERQAQLDDLYRAMDDEVVEKERP